MFRELIRKNKEAEYAAEGVKHRLVISHLPFAIMGMLVVYCLKDTSFTSVSGFLPVLIACTVVGVLYVWRRNTLISIIGGTVCYMILVQMVF